MKRLIPLLLLGVAGSACGAETGRLSAHDAWIREAPPGATAMAGYVVLRNGTGSALRCDAASSPDFGAIELHRTVIEDGQSRMLRDQVIELPAGGEARLQPGGLHLMLFRPQRPLPTGSLAELTIRCGSQTVTTGFRIQPQP